MNSFPVGGMMTRKRLWEHDAAHLLAVGHPERVGRFALAVAHRLDPGAEDLRHVRAVVEPEHHDAHLERAPGEEVVEDRREEVRELVQEVLRRPRHRQVEEEQLHDQRRAAEERGVEAADAVGDRVAGQPPQRPDQSERDRQHDPAGRHDQREDEPSGDEADVLPDPSVVERGRPEEEAQHREDRDPDERDLHPEGNARAGEGETIPPGRWGNDRGPGRPGPRRVLCRHLSPRSAL